MICSLRVNYTYRIFSLKFLICLFTLLVVYPGKGVMMGRAIFIFFANQTKMLMGEVMREAAFSLAEAKFTAGDFR